MVLAPQAKPRVTEAKQDLSNRTMSDTLETKLRRAWRKERLLAHLRGLAHGITWTIGLLLLAFLFDYAIELPGALRLAVALFILVFLGRVLWREWLRRLRHFHPARVALRVERCFPELKSLLVSAVELRKSPRRETTSPELLRATERLAEVRSSKLDFGAIVRFRTLRKIGLVAAGAMILALTLGIAVPAHLGIFLVRLFDPATGARYPTRTQVVSVTGDLAVRAGDPVRWTLVVGGELPVGAVLVLAPDGAPEEEVEIERGESFARGAARLRRFEWTLPEALRSIRYRFEAGDAETDDYTVEVISPPRIVDVHVERQPPPYTGRPADETGGLSFDALTGSDLVWRIRCDHPLESGTLVREGSSGEGTGEQDKTEPSSEHRLEIDESDPHRATIALRAERTFDYGFRWSEREHGFRFDDPARNHVEVVPDRSPRVRLRTPPSELKITTAATIELDFATDDDHGLATHAVVWSRDDGAESRAELGTFEPGTRASELRVPWEPARVIPELREGDALRIAVEVTDRRAPGEAPGRARSRSCRIDVVSTEDYLRWIEERKARALAELRGVLEEEIRASRNVRELEEGFR